MSLASLGHMWLLLNPRIRGNGLISRSIDYVALAQDLSCTEVVLFIFCIPHYPQIHLSNLAYAFTSVRTLSCHFQTASVVKTMLYVVVKAVNHVP